MLLHVCHLFFLVAMFSTRNSMLNWIFLSASLNASVNASNSERAHFTIAIITSSNLKEVNIATKHFLKDIEKATIMTTQIKVKVFDLGNFTSSLGDSLVKFCGEVVSENVTSVMIAEQLTRDRFNFIPWISSRLGIPVALVQNIRRYSSKQSQEWNMLYSLKPIIYEQSQVFSGLLSFFRWTHVVVLGVTGKSNHEHIEFLRRLQAENPILTVTITTMDLSNIKDITEKLNDVKKSDTAVIILHSSAPDAILVLKSAEKLGLLDGDRAWIVTESITEDTSGMSALPRGLLGVRLHTPCDPPNHASPLQHLVYDSLMVVAHAQTSYLNRTTLPSRPTSCDVKHEDCVTQNTDFFRQILKTKIDGKTGPVEFDSYGNRIHSEYDIYNLQESRHGTKVWIKIGHWNKNELACNRNLIQWPGGSTEPPTNILQLKTLRVVTAITEPFAFYGASKGYIGSHGGLVICAMGLPCKVYQASPNKSFSIEQKCCQGFAIDLLRMLQSDLGFMADLHVVKDEKYGGIDRDTGQWNGMIGELIRGEADVAIADLTIMDSRSRVVDFTQPFLHVGVNVLVAVRESRNSWLLRFLDPFTTELWIAVMLAVNTIFVLLWIIDRLSPYGHYRKGNNYKERKRFHLIASLWFSWGTVLRIDESEARPRSYSSRVVTVVFAFSMLVLTNSYTANLAAVLVTEAEVFPVSGIQDPMNPSHGFKFATVAETSTERFFKRSRDAVYSQIWKHMKSNQVKTFAEGVRKVSSGELTAFIGDEPTLKYFISRQPSCDLKTTGKPFFLSGFGIALPKNSTYTKRFSKVLMMYQELDTSRKLRTRWLSGHCFNKNKKGQGLFKSMTTHDLGGVYVMVIAGLLLSLLVLAFEIYVDKFGFPLSHIWTNKPHRSWPSSRELLKKQIEKDQSEAFSITPLELSISQRRLTQSVRSPWHTIYEESDYINGDRFFSENENDPETKSGRLHDSRSNNSDDFAHGAEEHGEALPVTIRK